MRVSAWAAARAKPPEPQMPITPIRSRSTMDCRPRKSTPALKFSVKISGEETCRGPPPDSPINDWSKVSTTKPRFANSLA